MNSIICQKCGHQNPSTMSFCSNCGQQLTAPQQSAQDLPPTMLSYQPNIQPPPPPQQQSPNVTQQQQQRPTQAPPPPVFQPAVNPPSVPPPGGKGGMNKGLLFGLLGCGGLLVLGVIGLVAGIAFIPGSKPTPTPYYNANVAVNTNTGGSNVNRGVAPTPPQTDGSDSAVLRQMQNLKQVGAFRQTEVKTVNAKDYFPLATGAVQSTYSNGSKIVVSTTGVFPSYSAAENNFNEQMKSVKNNGGTIYSNENKNGTQAAAYLYKGFYFIEACGEGACSRNNSSDLAALRSFATSLSSALQNPSSNFLPSSTGGTDAPAAQTISADSSDKTVSLGVVNGKATSLVTPAYPASARAVRASGAVNVQVTIDESGSVTSAQATSGHPLLRQAAEQAARASKFNPTVLSGQPVKASGILVYNFSAE